RIPILGWLRLRREVSYHGKGFWIRPMVVELALGIGLGWLYAWEVSHNGLYAAQIDAIAGAKDIGQWFVVPSSTLHMQFLVHALLILFMAAASFIDIDEHLIPDGVTVVGTLLGLILITLLPFALLPNVEYVVGESHGALTQ